MPADPRPGGPDATPAPQDASQVPVIAVASGKGGVGKTTVAVNLALALAAAGLRTGLVDADLYGPDVPRMLGLRRRGDAAQVTIFGVKGSAASRLQAVDRHGLQVSSAAFLIGENQGLGLQAGIAQLLVHRLISETQWDRPDCLVVDLPPGTADVQQFVFSLGRRPVHVLIVGKYPAGDRATRMSRRLIPPTCASTRGLDDRRSGEFQRADLRALRAEHADVPGRFAGGDHLDRDRQAGQHSCSARRQPPTLTRGGPSC